MEKKQNPVRGSLLLLLTATIWGVAFVAQSVGMEYVGPFTFNSTRFVIGFLVLVPVSLWLDRREKKTKAKEDKKADRTLLTGGVVCGILLFLASNFQQFGIKYSTVGKAGFITAFYIILVPIIGIFFRKKSGPLLWIAAVMALVGLYLLCMKDGFSLSMGDGLLLICAILFAFQILAVDHYSPLVSGVKLAMMEFMVCGVAGGILALIFERPSFSDVLSAWQPILYAGALSSGVAYTLQIIGQRDLNPTVASLIMSLEACISALAGWIILGQTLTKREIIGCVVMFAAIIIAQMPSPGTRSIQTEERSAV